MWTQKLTRRLWRATHQLKSKQIPLGFSVSQSKARYFTPTPRQAAAIPILSVLRSPWRASVQLFGGVVLIGTIVYNMMTGETTRLDSAYDKSAASLAEVDEVTKRRTKINKNSPMRLRMEA